jgi:hypothetical protein
MCHDYDSHLFQHCYPLTTLGLYLGTSITYFPLHPPTGIELPDEESATQRFCLLTSSRGCGSGSWCNNHTAPIVPFVLKFLPSHQCSVSWQLAMGTSMISHAILSSLGFENRYGCLFLEELGVRGSSLNQCLTDLNLEAVKALHNIYSQESSGVQESTKVFQASCQLTLVGGRKPTHPTSNTQGRGTM